MKIDSGNVLTQVPFIAVDSTDLVTRETGLTTFTVYRSRNGGTPVAMTTPTIVEADATNMPGVYWLLVDEDTGVDAEFSEQSMVLHISHAGMSPASLLVTLDNRGARLPDALDGGFLKAAIKRVGVTDLTPAGAGGQKYGG